MYVTQDHALNAQMDDLSTAVRELRDRAEIVDALFRFGLGQDLADRELFASSFAEDAELDFRPAAARWGAKPPLMVGRDTIVTTILSGFAGRVETRHQVTNVNLVRDGARWVMRRVRIDNVWYVGEPIAIFGGPEGAR
jgi:hypothetical protein